MRPSRPEEAITAAVYAGEDGIDEGDIDVVAYAGFFTVIQRCADGEASVQTAEQITDGHTGTGGLAARPAGDAHAAAHSLADEVVAGTIGIGAILAKAGDRSINQARIQLFALFIAEAQTAHNTGTVVFQQYISALYQFAEQFFSVLCFEVDGNTALIAVQILEIHAQSTIFFQRARVADEVAAGGQVFHLDNIGAHIGQIHTTVGTCQEVGEIKHTDALEKLSSHDKSSCGAILSRQNHFSRSGGGRPPKTHKIRFRKLNLRFHDNQV